MTDAGQWPTVLALGPTGAGKTSLIQAVFGDDTVPDDRVGHGAPMTREFDVYQSGGLRIIDSRGLEPGEYAEFRERVAKAIDASKMQPRVDRHVHVAWYCIPGCGARITAPDLATIREVLPHVLVVLTKTDLTRPAQLVDLERVLSDAGIPRENVLPCSIGAPDQLRALVERTSALFGASHRRVVKDARERRKRADATAQKLITQATIQSAAFALVPFLGATGVTAVRHEMVAGIARAFDREDDIERFWSTVGGRFRGGGWLRAAGLALPWVGVYGAVPEAMETRALGYAVRAFVATRQTLSAEALAAIGARHASA